MHLVKVLEVEQPVLSPDVLAKRVADKIDNADAVEITQLIRTIASLASIQRDYDLTADRLAGDVVQTFSDTVDEEEEPSIDELERLQSRLIALLSFDSSIGITSKAYDVMFENEHLLHSLRIVTDIRPVFQGNSTDQIAATVIVHSLKLSYHESGRLKNFFVALDATDLERLGQAIDRARLKSDAIADMLSVSNVRLLIAEEES